MAKDLTTSQIDRQNILNNEAALTEIQEAVNIKCIIWNERMYLTKEMVASFFGIDIRTLERYICKFGEELKKTGIWCLEEKNCGTF